MVFKSVSDELVFLLSVDGCWPRVNVFGHRIGYGGSEATPRNGDESGLEKT